MEFTYCNDRFAVETLNMKTTKYYPLVNNITTKGWTITPIMVLLAGACTTTHIPSLKILETKIKLHVTKIKKYI